MRGFLLGRRTEVGVVWSSAIRGERNGHRLRRRAVWFTVAWCALSLALAYTQSEQRVLLRLLRDRLADPLEGGE